MFIPHALATEEDFREEAPTCNRGRCANEGSPCSACGHAFCSDHFPYKDSDLCDECLVYFSAAAEKIFDLTDVKLISTEGESSACYAKLATLFGSLARKYEKLHAEAVKKERGF